MKNLPIKRFLAAAVIALPTGLLAVDTDGDGLDDSVETNTGIYVSPSNTGTNPNKADSDGDGVGDWYEVATIDTNPANAQPNAPNDPNIKTNIPYPLPKPDGSTGATNKPVKVYILSGQSNMVGQGFINPIGTAGTLSTIVKQQGKFPNLLDASGNWSVRNDVMYRGLIAAVGNGPLTVGQGSDSTLIGPELGFGHVMGYYHDEPVLLIKSSQGGRALGWDFLPPGSVPYTVGSTTYAGYGDSPASWTTGSTPVPTAFYGGYQYDQCFLRKADWAPAGAGNAAVYNVTDVLDHFATEYPQYAAQGYEIAGFVWWQGWNDGLTATAAYASRYETNMAQFIRQIRAYYESRYPGRIKSKAPFVLATCGFQGWTNPYATRQSVVSGQLAVGDPVKYPEFAGNVKTMETRNFWRDASVSPANVEYHYNRNAETFMLVGDALGRAMIDLLKAAAPDTTPPVVTGLSPATGTTGVATGSNLVLTFNEAIAVGTGNITLRNLTDSTQVAIAVTDASQVTASGAFLTINPTADLAGGKSYAIRIDATAIKDLSNNPFAGIADDTTWAFTTLAPDTTAPVITTYSPADNATGVTVKANLVLTFSEAIAPGSGNITLRNLTDSTQTVIPVTDGSQVSIAGTVLTINPTADLAGNRSYAIRIDSGAVKDLANNSFAGIGDDTTWNFTTAAPPTSAVITIVSHAIGYADSTKTKFATAHLGTTLLSYNATGVDKLVVAIGLEAGFNNKTSTISGVTFNGVALTQAVQDSTQPNTSYDGGSAAIYYLDNPYQGAATFTFTNTSAGGGINGALVSVIGLSGTAAGIGNTGKNAVYQAATGNVATSITTSAANSLVIAMVEDSGNNNNSITPSVVAPLTLSDNGTWAPSRWGAFAAGTQSVATSGTTITPTFNSAAGNNHVIAAEIIPLPLTAPYTAWGSGPFPSGKPLNNSSPALDYDSGGLSTGIEWVTGGDPTNPADDASVTPTIDNKTDPNYFIYTYRRTQVANSDANTTITVEYGSTPGAWTTAVHDGSNIIITPSIGGGGTGVDLVQVKIKRTLAGGNKLFVRLKVMVAQS